MSAHVALALGVWVSAMARAETWTLRNPTGQTYSDEAVRLHLSPLPEAFAVKQDGRDVPYQVETLDGRPFVWVLVSMAKGDTRAFSIGPGARATGEPKVVVRLARDTWELDNGLIAARLPGPEAVGLVGPVRQVRLPNGKWVGEGFWRTSRNLKRFTSEVIGDGQVFAKVRLRYEFDGLAGIDGKTPAFAVADVALYPGQRHVVIEEAHEMGRDDAWEFDLCVGWDARTPILEVFGGGAGRMKNPSAIPTDLKMLGWDPDALQSRYDRGDPRLGDTLMWLVPRANQHYEDGWVFAVTDGKLAAGCMPTRAGRWFWPHDNKISVQARETADYAGLRCPTRRGKRHWFLVVGGRDDFATQAAGAYTLRYGYKGLDKILTDYITDWPGKDEAEGFYAGGFNPLFLKRGFIRDGGQSHPRDTPMEAQTAFQVALDPDMYGEYWQFWSPENPNFFTSFYAGNGMGLLPKLEQHPRYGDLKRLAATKVAEDIYHSFTLPSGAGQECPGYMSVGGLTKMSSVCEGFPFASDAKARVAAAQRFKRRISFPDGSIRRNSPMGDSHPGREGGGMSPCDAPADEVKGWATEELQGYGVVFTANPGTPKETYLAFKSGPNRGHYHGDQLAFHYCADARPVAVDHHCSYKPRAGQEHMHNRVAFFTDDMPFANVDGYERLIAFRTSADADVAMGQVESDRLRWVQAYPPEDWDRDYPQVPFEKPLIYRRTVVMVKGRPSSAEGAATEGEPDYFVIRDQYRAPRPLHAAYCLHVLDEAPKSTVGSSSAGGSADGNRLRDAAADFTKAGVQPGWTLAVPKRGIYKVAAVEMTTLQVDRPIPAATGLVYRASNPVESPGERVFRAGNLLLYCAAPAAPSAYSFPWSHSNGGYEGTQGIRLQISGDSGEFVTVLYPLAADAKAPVLAAAPGGVKVDDDEVRFGGGLDQDSAAPYVTVQRGGKTVLTLTGEEIDPERNQGDIGLFVPNTGYPFGEIPDWLIRQRMKPPTWYRPVLPLGYGSRQ